MGGGTFGVVGGVILGVIGVILLLVIVAGLYPTVNDSLQNLTDSGIALSFLYSPTGILAIVFSVAVFFYAWKLITGGLGHRK